MDLAGRLVGLERERRRVEAEIVAALAEADAAGVWAEDGHGSVAVWAQAVCNWSPGEARTRTWVMRLGRAVPAAIGALAGGVVGTAEVGELARLNANPRCAAKLVDSAGLLVEQAQDLWFVDFKTVCQRWEQLADDDGAHRTHERARRDRGAYAAIVGAQVHLNASGDVVAGTEMVEILDRFTDAEFRSDWDELRAVFGDATHAGLLERTRTQMRFDALHTIFRTAAGASPEVVGDSPLVNLVIDADSFERVARRCAGELVDPPDPAAVLLRRCETMAGAPVDPWQVLSAALVGQLRRVIVDSTGRVLDIGRRRRLFTRAVREAVALTDRHCLWPGCTVRTAHSQLDHSQPWSAGGASDVSNSGPGCGRHNRFKNRGDTTRRDHAGCWHTYRPDGTEIAPRRAPP